jgi:molecular chaperone DnaK (HSP70)
MPLFEVNTVSLFRHKYIIEAKTLEHAYDTVLIDKPEELTQKHLDETILDGRKIDRKEFERLCKESLDDSTELSNAHLGTRIIYKVDYDES